MNLSDLLGGGSAPLGSSVIMPSSTAPSISMPGGDIYVKNSAAALVPTSICGILLPTMVNSTADVSVNGTITTLSKFTDLVPLLTSTLYAANAVHRVKPKMLFVGGIYYIFNHYFPNGANTSYAFGYATSTNSQDWSGVQSMSQLSRDGSQTSINIVDITNVSGTWYFLDASGLIYSTTDVATQANFTIYYLPVSSYRKFAYINSNWYIVGASRTGTGYIVLKSSALSSFTISESTSTGSTAISICQGSGTGSTTEILITCASDHIIKSVDNGGTFTLVSTVSAVSGGIIKNCMYSTTTNKYHLAVNGTGDTVSMVVSNGSTLTGATWTVYSSVTAYASSLNNSYLTLVDTGTNVGIMSMNTSGAYSLYYGASYNTAGTANITTTDRNLLDNSTSNDNGLSYWLNSKLFTFYGSSNNARTLFVSSGATCSTGITRLISVSDTNDVWSGVTYLSGSYYALKQMVGYSTGVSDKIGAFLYKFNSALTLVNFPVTPITVSVGSYTGTLPTRAAGAYDSTGTKINWIACDYNNSSPTSNTCWSYDGSALTSIVVSATNPQPITSANSINTDTTNLFTSCNLAIPKWSSLYSKYIFAMPCVANHASLTTGLVKVTSSATIGGSQTDIVSVLQAGAGLATKIVSCDVLNDGQVIYGYTTAAAGSNYTIQYFIANPTKTTTIFSSTQNSITLSMWNFAYSGSNYLVFAYSEIGIAYFKIYKLNTTDNFSTIFSSNITGSIFSVLPLASISASGVSLSGNGILKRTITYNSEIYLMDGANSATGFNKNTIKLTPSGNTFIATPVYVYTTGDFGSTGNANVSSNNNSVTVSDATPTPIVVLQPGVANSYLRVK